MVRVAVVGGSGYTGLELLRLCYMHPMLEINFVTSRQYAGRSISDVFPLFTDLIDKKFSKFDPDEIAGAADYAFLALPHKESMNVAVQLLKKGVKVIDLSADFRFRDPAVYEKWYQKHIWHDYTVNAVYGLPEIYRDAIKRADLIGNPGCYPTSVILPLAPLLKAGVLNTASIIVDSKSGVTGAGRSPSLATHFCEVNDNFKAYKVYSHRHTPEIEQELSICAGEPVKITFTPHLVPLSRGILSTIYLTLNRDMGRDEISEIYASYYRNESFVRVYPPGSLPQTHNVRGTNLCDIGFELDAGTNRLTLVSVIDNLMRGASGQAIVNLNLMAGLPEKSGIDSIPFFP